MFSLKPRGRERDFRCVGATCGIKRSYVVEMYVFLFPYIEDEDRRKRRRRRRTTEAISDGQAYSKRNEESLITRRDLDGTVVSEYIPDVSPRETSARTRVRGV